MSEGAAGSPAGDDGGGGISLAATLNVNDLVDVVIDGVTTLSEMYHDSETEKHLPEIDVLPRKMIGKDLTRFGETIAQRDRGGWRWAWTQSVHRKDDYVEGFWDYELEFEVEIVWFTLRHQTRSGATWDYIVQARPNVKRVHGSGGWALKAEGRWLLRVLPTEASPCARAVFEVKVTSECQGEVVKEETFEWDIYGNGYHECLQAG